MSRAGTRLGWQAVSVGSVAGLLGGLWLLEPDFWLAGDKRNQYVPVLQDMGRRLRAGDFPAVDPDLGASGNYALDTQYAVQDPVHLAIAWLVAPLESQALAGFLLALVFLPLTAWGTTLLVQRLTDAPALAALAGVGAATSGYLFFQLAPDWWPGLFGTALLPWVWWALVGPPRVHRLVLVAVLSALVVASGWPSTWLGYVALTLGVAVESLTRDEPWGRRTRPLLARALAAGAGVAVATAGLVPILRASDWTDRSQEVENTFAQILNVADLLAFASPYLREDLLTYQNTQDGTALPIFFFGWFLLVLAWLVPWRAALLRHPGVVTALVAAVVMLLLSQAPSVLGPVRFQIRQLAGVQLFALVAVVLAAAHVGLRLSRVRLAGIAASVVAVGFLAWARSPERSEPLVGVGVVTVAVLVLLLAVRLDLRRAPSRLTLTSVVGVVGTMALTAVAFGWAVAGDRSEATPDEEPALALEASDLPALAVYPKADPTSYLRWRDQGVGPGFTTLSATQRYAPGYSSVSQRHFLETLGLQSAHGYARPGLPEALATEVDGTGAAWVDVLGYRTLLVERSMLDAVERWLPTWRPVAESTDFVQLQRPGTPGAVGRVTATVGEVTVTEPATEGEVQSYDVATEEGALLVMRDVYWPGYVARVDDRPVRVRAVDDVVVGVELPPGTQGRLVVEYRLHTPASLGLTLGGGAVLLLAAVLLRPREERASGEGRLSRRRRRARRTPPS